MPSLLTTLLLSLLLALLVGPPVLAAADPRVEVSDWSTGRKTINKSREGVETNLRRWRSEVNETEDERRADAVLATSPILPWIARVARRKLTPTPNWAGTVEKEDLAKLQKEVDEGRHEKGDWTSRPTTRPRVVRRKLSLIPDWTKPNRTMIEDLRTEQAEEHGGRGNVSDHYNVTRVQQLWAHKSTSHSASVLTISTPTDTPAPPPPPKHPSNGGIVFPKAKARRLATARTKLKDEALQDARLRAWLQDEYNETIAAFHSSAGVVFDRKKAKWLLSPNNPPKRDQQQKAWLRQWAGAANNRSVAEHRKATLRAKELELASLQPHGLPKPHGFLEKLFRKLPKWMAPDPKAIQADWEAQQKTQDVPRGKEFTFLGPHVPYKGDGWGGLFGHDDGRLQTTNPGAPGVAGKGTPTTVNWNDRNRDKQLAAYWAKRRKDREARHRKKAAERGRKKMAKKLREQQERRKQREAEQARVDEQKRKQAEADAKARQKKADDAWKKKQDEAREAQKTKEKQAAEAEADRNNPYFPHRRSVVPLANAILDGDQDGAADGDVKIPVDFDARGSPADRRNDILNGVPVPIEEIPGLPESGTLPPPPPSDAATRPLTKGMSEDDDDDDEDPDPLKKQQKKPTKTEKKKEKDKKNDIKSGIVYRTAKLRTRRDGLFGKLGGKWGTAVYGEGYPEDVREARRPHRGEEPAPPGRRGSVGSREHPRDFLRGA
ncbi:MAG: hypothetical protein M1817_003409 [Caeruleum heppii]|nr:MAG: hypothetical protein M1817_003409 [Caeruleum heppii]